MKIYLTILLMIFSTSLNAQEDTLYSVKISTNIISPLISFDSSEFIPLDENSFMLGKGEYFIRIKTNEVANRWVNMESVLSVNINSDTTLIMNSLIRYSFITEPFNAEVYYKDTLLGLTPLRYVTENFLEGMFTIKKEGYFNLTDYFESEKLLYRFDLKSLSGVTTEKVIINREIGFESPRNWFLISGLGAATLTSAYASFNFKSKANELYDEYVITRNNSTLSESNKNDTYFIVSLIAMQAALGVLIYFLFFD